MTHVMDQPQTLAEIEHFKAEMRRQFVCFDPADVDEFLFYTRGLEADTQKFERFDFQTDAGPVSVRPADVQAISKDILGQTYARDFKMIDQSEMIISIIPELPGGKPALSSGVERELQHAFEAGKEVYVIWPSRSPASPFVTQTATAVFPSPTAAMEHFKARGYLTAPLPRRSSNSLFEP